MSDTIPLPDGLGPKDLVRWDEIALAVIQKKLGVREPTDLEYRLAAVYLGARGLLQPLRAQVDALRGFVHRWAEIIGGGDKRSMLEGWAQEFMREADEALPAKRLV